MGLDGRGRVCVEDLLWRLLEAKLEAIRHKLAHAVLTQAGTSSREPEPAAAADADGAADAAAAGAPQQRHWAARLFRDYDADSTGLLEAQVFLGCARRDARLQVGQGAASKPLLADAELMALFEFMDRDRDGAVSLAEFSRVTAWACAHAHPSPRREFTGTLWGALLAPF